MKLTIVRRVTKMLLQFSLTATIVIAFQSPAQSAAPKPFAVSSIPAVRGSDTVNLDQDRLPIAPLPQFWRFHVGDDPSWAKQSFDDSTWPLLRSNSSWAEQGYDGYSGFAWYRFRIEVPPHEKHVSLILPNIRDIFEIFSDGTRIGSSGKMPPFPRRSTFVATVYTASSAANVDSELPTHLTIAVRVWCRPAGVYYGGGPIDSGGETGESTLLKQHWEMDVASAYWSQGGLEILVLLRTLTALGAFALFVLRRKESEYLWFSLMTGCTALRGWLFVAQIAHSWDAKFLYFWLELIFDVGSLATIVFYVQLLRSPRSWLMRIIVLITLLEIPSAVQTHLFPELFNPAISALLLVLLNFPSAVYLLILLIHTARLRTTAGSQWLDARLLLVPYILGVSVQWFNEAAYLTWDAGLQHKMSSGDLTVIAHPFVITLSAITGALSLMGIFAVLVLRFARTRGEEERYATEVEGARSVQQFLIPNDLPVVAGLIIESDYRPALEVGGDFFQVIPDSSDGSALIIVGDVAGKGLQAGMLATLLVGSVRTATTFTRDPSVIMSTLNNRLCGKGSATALVLRVESGGRASLVNAGHLPPYHNGVELPMEGALPLGTIDGIEFPLLTFQLDPGDTLTIMSDGIVEAQRPDGELFGFDRIATHIRNNLTAFSLAEAAQRFGQSDDITVLTVNRVSNA